MMMMMMMMMIIVNDDNDDDELMHRKPRGRETRRTAIHVTIHRLHRSNYAHDQPESNENTTRRCPPFVAWRVRAKDINSRRGHLLINVATLHWDATIHWDAIDNIVFAVHCKCLAKYPLFDIAKHFLESTLFAYFNPTKNCRIVSAQDRREYSVGTYIRQI